LVVELAVARFEFLPAFSREQLAAFAARHRLHSREEFEARHGQFNYQEASACIGFAPDFATAQASFKERLKNRILESYLVQSMNGKGTFIIRQLFRAYLDNPQQLPNPTIVRLYRQCLPEELPDDPPADLTETIGNLRHKLERVLRRDPRYREDMSRVICDYIAGMTDSYALGEYHRLYG
ncbi:MAG: hypothetical protein NUV35_07755, partial [Syntrophomonadaceae bacterium]|nr:hypothetical protein [Syntrophomonadaceae bacterium]